MGALLKVVDEHFGSDAALRRPALELRLASERVDLTLPAVPRRKGSVHPTMQVMDEMTAIAARLPEMSDLSRARLDRAMATIGAGPDADWPIDRALATRDALLAKSAA